MAEGPNFDQHTKKPQSAGQDSAARVDAGQVDAGEESGKRAVSAAKETEQKDPLMAEVEALHASLEEEKAKAEDYLKNWQRAQADFINFKRRTEQERVEQTKFANSALILKIIPVLDDFERAFATLPREVEGIPWLEGIALIERKLRFILEQEGVTPIEALGNDFDPNLHEAVLLEEGTDPQHGVVVAELQKGYKLHDRVIRPTMVKVGQPMRASHVNEADAKKANANAADVDAKEAEANTADSKSSEPHAAN